MSILQDGDDGISFRPGSIPEELSKISIQVPPRLAVVVKVLELETPFVQVIRNHVDAEYLRKLSGINLLLDMLEFCLYAPRSRHALPCRCPSTSHPSFARLKTAGVYCPEFLITPSHVICWRKGFRSLVLLVSCRLRSSHHGRLTVSWTQSSFQGRSATVFLAGLRSVEVDYN